MRRFEKLRHDHLLLMKLTDELASLAAREVYPCRVELFGARTMLASSLIRHLKEEDWVVYPSLLQSDDRKVRDSATALHREMGGLADAFSAYMERWTSFAIERDWQTYRRETSTLLKVLKRRIKREDDCLYTDDVAREPSDQSSNRVRDDASDRFV